MKTQPLLTLLTVVNVGILAFLVFQLRPAAATGGMSVLRGSGLEIVDERGKVRASIKVYPADPRQRLPDGTTLPETTLLRLIDPSGGPAVKLSASERGAILLLGGGKEGTYIQLVGADGIRLVKNGKQRLIEQ
jgi:hypothetical protein